MKQRRKPRRIFARVKGQLMPGILMSIPDEMNAPTLLEQADSVASITCPKCGTRYFVNQQTLDTLEEIKNVHEAIDDAGLRHRPCNMLMHIHPLEGEVLNANR